MNFERAAISYWIAFVPALPILSVCHPRRHLSLPPSPPKSFVLDKGTFVLIAGSSDLTPERGCDPHVRTYVIPSDLTPRNRSTIEFFDWSLKSALLLTIPLVGFFGNFVRGKIGRFEDQGAKLFVALNSAKEMLWIFLNKLHMLLLLRYLKLLLLYYLILYLT